MAPAVSGGRRQGFPGGDLGPFQMWAHPHGLPGSERGSAAGGTNTQQGYWETAMSVAPARDGVCRRAGAPRLEGGFMSDKLGTSSRCSAVAGVGKQSLKCSYWRRSVREMVIFFSL